VVQLIVAPEAVTLELATLDIAGAVVSATAAVVKVQSPETARFPAASFERTR